MPIQLNTDKLSSAYVESGAGQTGEAVRQAAPQSILGGASVQVSAAPSTDLEKLVAQIKNENEQAKANMAQRRIAILLTVLGAMGNRITEQQRNNLVQIETSAAKISDLERQVQSLEEQAAASEKQSAVLREKIAALEAAIEKAAEEIERGRAQIDELRRQLPSAPPAEAVVLEAKIKSLEEAVARAVKDGEEHRKQVEETKRLKAEEDAKAQRCETSIVSAREEIGGLRAKIAECERAIGSATLGEIAAAVRAAAGEAAPDPARPDSPAEEEKAAKKAEANNPIDLIRDALDRMDADIMRTIEENQVIKA